MRETSSLLIIALCLTIRCMSEEFRSLRQRREQLSKLQRLFQTPRGFRQLQQLLGRILENWVGSRVREPEKHSDQPVLQPGFHQNLHWNQHNSVENMNSKKLTVSDSSLFFQLFFLTSFMYSSFVKKRLAGD